MQSFDTDPATGDTKFANPLHDMDDNTPVGTPRFVGESLDRTFPLYNICHPSACFDTVPNSLKSPAEYTFNPAYPNQSVKPLRPI
jgi:hypothetical protein